MMTANFNNSSATLDSTITTTGAAVNHRHHHNNSDAVATDGSDTTADNASNSAGDAMADSADDSGDLLGGTGLAAMDPAPPVPSGSPPPGPALSGGGNSVDYAPGGPPIPIDQLIGVSETPSTTPLISATVSITAGFFTGDRLNYAPNGIYANISGSYDPNLGRLTLTSPHRGAPPPSNIRQPLRRSPSPQPTAIRRIRVQMTTGRSAGR